MTNADVIRGMTNEELSQFMEEYSVGNIHFSRGDCRGCDCGYFCDICRDWWLFEIDAKDHWKGLLHQASDGYTLRTCDTCGRASNNCIDGKTRCPIEEHYVLPKDGRCHLWEPMNWNI